MRRGLAVVLAAGVVAALGLGSSGSDQARASSAQESGPRQTKPRQPSIPSWVRSGLSRPGEIAELLLGTTDFAPGRNRLSFALIRRNQSLVQRPEASLYVGREGAGAPTQSVRAALSPIGAHSHPAGSRPHDHPDMTDVYVAHVVLPAPGRYWLLVETKARPVRGAAVMTVPVRSRTPAIGSKAIPSRNPTLSSAAAEKITTARPPDRELLRYSVAETLRAHKPFVLVFATPKFCQSRVCGPTVEIVDAVRRRVLGRGVRFIHIEIYAGNDPANGFNRWVREWSLPTEPWVFLVDRRGIVRAKYENAVSVDELEQAVQRLLL